MNAKTSTIVADFQLSSYQVYYEQNERLSQAFFSVNAVRCSCCCCFLSLTGSGGDGGRGATMVGHRITENTGCCEWYTRMRR